jgi:hypothetical protein
MQKPLLEGLRPNDLEDLVFGLFEVDTYKSKMGEDRDVCVVTFKVKDRNPAKDLMEFIEKGYHFVLDADVSSGENSDGNYYVFVEISRSKDLAENIKDLISGVSKLTGLREWSFKYHKQESVNEANSENLKSKIPDTPASYEGFVVQVKTEGVKKFFSKTLMDDLKIDGDIITIYKPFNQKLSFKWLNQDDPQPVIEGAESLDPNSTAEIFWLTKVLGDYGISKFGDRLLLTNGNKNMLLQRIEL